MLDKSLIKSRFEKSMETYEDNAVIQKIMAKRLAGFLKKKDVERLYEIGCSTGLLTREIMYRLNVKEYYANDLVEKSEKYFKEIVPYGMFCSGDIEEINIPKNCDLIVSNACLQWCDDPCAVIDKAYESLKDNGILAVSLFGKNNLKEVRNILKIPSGVFPIDLIKEHILKYTFTSVEESINEIYFSEPLDVLKHLKYTGANAIQHYTMTKSKLDYFESKYKELYAVKGKKVRLTYNPVYIILTKYKAKQ